MKNTKISRRSFLLGLAACSAAGVLTACSGSSEPASSASTAPEPPASSAASEVTAAPFLTVEDFPALDGSTACIPLMAQMLADTTGMDLEEAQSIISVSTTAYAWESFGLYNTDTKMLVVYEAPDSVKEELEAANVQLEQKPIGVDALVFIVNEDNPVTDLTQQQLRDIYAGKITNWKDVGGQDLDIVAFQRRSDSGSQTLFQKLLIQGGELMDPPTELAPTAMGELVDSLAAYNNSANAIGFSVYYYIDQMYSQPGLRLLSVDGVMPSNDTLADGSYPLCNDFYAVIRPDAKTKATYNGADSSYTKNYLAFDAYDNYASALQAAGLTYSYALTITVPVRQSGDVKAIAGTDDQSADFDGLAPHKYSERTAEVIDEEVLGLVETAHTEAWNIINDNRDVLDELVRQLLVKETLNEKELAAIFANSAREIGASGRNVPSA